MNAPVQVANLVPPSPLSFHTLPPRPPEANTPVAFWTRDRQSTGAKANHCRWICNSSGRHLSTLSGCTLRLSATEFGLARYGSHSCILARTRRLSKPISQFGIDSPRSRLPFQHWSRAAQRKRKWNKYDNQPLEGKRASDSAPKALGSRNIAHVSSGLGLRFPASPFAKPTQAHTHSISRKCPSCRCNHCCSFRDRFFGAETQSPARHRQRQDSSTFS
jgi:hypothetical protein